MYFSALVGICSCKIPSDILAASVCTQMLLITILRKVIWNFYRFIHYHFEIIFPLYYCIAAVFISLDRLYFLSFYFLFLSCFPFSFSLCHFCITAVRFLVFLVVIFQHDVMLRCIMLQFGCLGALE